MEEKDQIEHLLRFLENEHNNHSPWIQRKETATWSAVVLYLSGLLIVSGYIFSHVDSKTLALEILFPLASLFIMLIFAYFVFLQFGFISNAIVIQHSIIYWISRIIGGKAIPKKFLFDTENSVYPISIKLIYLLISKSGKMTKENKELLKTYKDHLPEPVPKYLSPRRKNILIRFCLPLKHVFSKNKDVAHIEREEGIIYHLFLWPTVLVFMYFFIFFDC